MKIWNVNAQSRHSPASVQLIYEVGHSSNSASFATGFLYTPAFVFTLQTRTVSSFPGKIFMTRARGQSPLWVFSSTTRTKSPALTLHVLWFHFFRAIRVGRYSRNHLTQTWLIETCVCLHHFLLEISLSAKTPQGSTRFARDIRKWFGVMASKSLLLELTS